MEAIRIDKYTLLNVEQSEQYGIKLVEGWESRDGSFKPNFCKRSFKKGGEEKTTPVSVKLGDKTMAVSVCLMLLRELTGVDWVKEEAPF
jgi:hypothetical protein